MTIVSLGFVVQSSEARADIHHTIVAGDIAFMCLEYLIVDIEESLRGLLIETDHILREGCGVEVSLKRLELLPLFLGEFRCIHGLFVY
jgi:hypothetical protein